MKLSIVEQIEVPDMMPELILPEPAMIGKDVHEQSGTIVNVYLDKPEKKKSRRERLRKYLPPSPKALYDFVGLSQAEA